MFIRIILFLAIAYALVISIGASFIFWFVTFNNPEKRIPSPKPGIIPCIRHFVMALGSHILCCVVLVPGLFMRKAPGSQPREKGVGFPPIILVHGLHNNAGVWLYFIRKLEKAGYPVSTFSYMSFITPLDTIIQNLDAHIRQVEAASTGEKPIILAHSLGSLLARKWAMQQGEKASRLGGIVTLGAPHQGSGMSMFAYGALAKNIRLDGALVNELKSAPPLPFPCVSLASGEDECVLPTSSLLPPDDWKLRLLPDSPHFASLFCPHAARMVLEELDGMREQAKK